MVGNWEVNININGMPQKIASAVSKLSETLVGAEYDPIAYLGSQQVNGINHAVLAEQTVVTGRDSKNIVMLIFNEKPNEREATLVSIDRIVEGGDALGGTQINATTVIPEEAMNEWRTAFEGFLGAKYEPFALLGTQVVKGTNFIFAVKVTPITPNGVPEVAIVTINTMTGTMAFADPFETKQGASLGYAFTWLKNGFGKPLGEWP